MFSLLTSTRTRLWNVTPNTRHSAPENSLQMLVLNVNNSHKMPLWHFNSPYWRMSIQNALLLYPSWWREKKHYFTSRKTSQIGTFYEVLHDISTFQNKPLSLRSTDWKAPLSKPSLFRYHPPSSTLLALIGASAFAFNKYSHKPYIFWKRNSFRLLLISFQKSKY